MARILIVDPDEQVADRLMGQFISMGHKCAKERDGREALKLAETGKLDLVLLEVMLPGMSGFELCRRIRMNTNLYPTLLVFLSNMSSEEEIEHGLAQGADDFIPKPLQVRSVVQRVDALIAGRTANQMLDDVTQLPGPKHIKLDIQRAIQLKSRFSVAYVEMTNLIPFGRSLGNEARLRAMKDMAHGLSTVGKKLETKMFKVAHMGGGHYVCILDPSLAEGYCDTICKTWMEYLPRLYETLGHKWVLNPETKKNGPGNLPLLETMICITTYDPRYPGTAQQLFDTLTSLRKKAIEGGGRGLFVDKRRDTVRSPV